MATTTFDGSASQTVNFNAAVDRIVFDLDLDEVANVFQTDDTVTFVAASGAVLTLQNTNIQALTADNFLTDIDFAFGTDGPDTLTGEVVLGGEDIDTLTATANDALIYGNQDNDIIDGSTFENVSLFGGMDDDSIVGGATGSLVVGGLGEDTIAVGAGVAGEGVTIYGGNEAGDPTDSADTITGSAGDDLVFGNGGNDVTDGNGGADTIFGGQGDDSITVGATATGDAVSVVGGLGEDTIDAGSATEGVTIYGGNEAGDPTDAADSIVGGSGDDLIYGNGGDDTIDGGGGAESIFGGQGDDSITGFSDESVVYGGLGDDTITADAGTADGVTIYGGNGSADAADGADSISGSGFDDVVYGNAGADTIIGAAGDDSIFGGAGDDDITGGVGIDVLTGGTGADTFAYIVVGDTPLAGTEVESILDFNADEDSFDFGSAVTSVVSATLAIATDAADIINGIVVAGTQAGIVTVSAGELAGTYIVGPGEAQLIDVTGFTGSFDTDSFNA